MLVNDKKINRIKDIIEKYHKYILLALGGTSSKTEADNKDMDDHSVLERIYNHNYINEHGSEEAPSTLSGIKEQQKEEKIPEKVQIETSKNQLKENLKHLIQKQKMDILSRIEGIIRDRNTQFKLESLKEADKMLKDKSIAQIKTTLRDLARDANRNFQRIASTEMSNAISLGSLDRIVEQNTDKDPDEIYVFRVVKNDAALCKWCRRFYLDRDGSPKVYRLGDILGNGSNYGKPKNSWRPVVTATHPSERCSQLIELKPGFKVLSGGSVTFIGRDKWAEYIKKKV